MNILWFWSNQITAANAGKRVQFRFAVDTHWPVMAEFRRWPMDTRIEICNVLHDGEITVISEDGDTLTMFVSIPYLRRRLQPLGDSFILTLAGVRQAEYRDFSGAQSSVRSLREELEIGTPEILQTQSESMPVTIDTTMGQLILDFQSVRFALDTGQTVEFEAIAKVCEEYWTEWEAKAEQARHDTSA